MRISGGCWRGRRLHAPRGGRQRPTQERVREALFARLGQHVDGARVIDLYAGSGALGLEALSRGAAEAVFVERARPALAALARNIDALEARATCRVVAGPVAAFLEGRFGRVSGVTLLLADPPYETAGVDFPERVVRAPAIDWAAVAWIVLETSRREPEAAIADGWYRRGSYQYGETRVTIDARGGMDEQAGGDGPPDGDIPRHV